MSGDSIKNLVNQMVSRYMGNSVQSPLTLPAVNDLSVGADEYARKHKPATGQLGLFEKPEERQKPLFSKKVDDEAGRWVTMRGARVYISNDDGRVMKGPKRLMGKTGAQIEAEGKAAGKGEGTPKPKPLNELGRISGGKKQNRQGKLWEEINPGFKWDEDDDVKSITPSLPDDEDSFSLSNAQKPEPKKPEASTSTNTEATKQGALFDSGKGKGDLKGQELLFNSDAGDVGNPRTMENRVKDEPKSSSSSPSPAVKSPEDTIAEHLQNNDHEAAYKAFGQLKKAEIDSVARKVLGSGFYNQSKSQMLEALKRALPFATKQAIEEQEKKDEISSAEKALSRAKENKQRHSEGLMGAPIRKGVPEIAYSDPHGKGREEVAKAWQAEVDEAQAALDKLKGVATKDTGPQDGDRDATGLVFRDGRWHRDDEGEVEGEKQEAPSTSPAVNPFREKMDSLNRKADSLTPGGSSFDKQMASAFPLGVGRSGNASSRKTSKQAAKRIDQSVNNALKSIEVRKKANALKGQAEAFDRGEIDEHGNRTELGRSKDAEQLAKSQEKKQAVASFWDDHSDWLKSTLQKGRKMAIAENPSNTVTVARINKTGITTDSGSKWMYRDLIPLGDDGKAMSPKDVISKVKEWKEKKQNPDKYSRHQLVAFANSLTDKYVRGEAGVVQIPVDKYAHPLVHAAVGGLGHMAVQSLVKNTTLRRIAHAAVASAMAAWMASANAQSQGPSSSPAVNGSGSPASPASTMAPLTPGQKQSAGNAAVNAIVQRAFQNHQQMAQAAYAQQAGQGQSQGNQSPSGQPGQNTLSQSLSQAGQSGNESPRPLKDSGTAGKGEGAGSAGFSSNDHPRHPAGAPESQGGEFAPKGDGSTSGEPAGTGENEGGSRNYPDNLNKPADQQTNYSPPERSIESLAGGGEPAEPQKSLADKIAEHRMKLASQKTAPEPKSSRRDNPNSSWKSAMSGATERLEQQKAAKQQARKQATQQKKAAQQQEQATSFNPAELAQSDSDDSNLISGEDSTPYDDKPKPDDFKREKDYQRALKAWNREKGARKASVSKKIAKSVVPSIALEYELSEDELSSAVNDSIAMESEGLKRQEEARKYVVERGYNAGRINRNEDSGIDHSSSQLDEFASEWAGLYPEIAGSDESQWVDRMWNLAKAGPSEIPSAGDEDFVRKVAERLHSSRGQSPSSFPADSGSDSNPAPVHGQVGDVDFTPFSRNSLVDSLNLIVDRYMRETINTKLHVT